jgi:hypothetical protein
MEGSTTVVGLNTLAQKGHVLELVADEGARNLDLLAANDHDLLSLKKLLGHNGGQATKKMALAVNNDSLQLLSDSYYKYNQIDAVPHDQ